MNNNPWDTVVVGGGPAGAAAATELAIRGHRVLVLERAREPGVKVCGEFLSPDALRELIQLDPARSPIPSPFSAPSSVTGIDDGTVPGSRIAVVRLIHGGTRIRADLDPPGGGLSRARLDGMLLGWAIARGAEVRVGVEVTRVYPEGGHWVLEAVERAGRRPVSFEARGVIVACGRRQTGVDPVEAAHRGERPSMIGFQTEMPAAPFPDEIVLHFFDEGYLGVAPVEGNVWNICGVVRADVVRRGQKNIRTVLERWIHEDPVLSEGFGDALISAPWHTVALPAFRVRGPVMGELPCAGDYAGAIHPFCGDGIAMALQSGRLVAQWMDRFLRDEIEWPVMLQGYARAWSRMFLRRFRWSGWLNAWVSRGWLRRWGARLLCRIPGGVNFLYRRTRGIA